MRLRDFLLAFHLATKQNPKLATTLLPTLRTMQVPQALRQIVQDAFQDPIFTTSFQQFRQERFITYLDDAYPERLRQIPQPPLILFYQGELKLLQRVTLGVVGARQATAYTAHALDQLFPDLTQVVIVSGLARGADGIAHRAALQHHLGTIAVVAHGLDHIYPAEHAQLFGQIKTNGLILSEYPLGTRPQPFRFVARNRIIAGLSHGLLVTEAKNKSGSLITANYALQNNREVFALPNRMDDLLGQGTNGLIQAGAKLILTAEDLQNELHFYP